jgi:hypothetical protein
MIFEVHVADDIPVLVVDGILDGLSGLGVNMSVG